MRFDSPSNLASPWRHPRSASAGRGYPERLVGRIVNNANGLQVMAGMQLAMFDGNQEAALKMRTIQLEFADCLPELLER